MSNINSFAVAVAAGFTGNVVITLHYDDALVAVFPRFLSLLLPLNAYAYRVVSLV